VDSNRVHRDNPFARLFSTSAARPNVNQPKPQATSDGPCTPYYSAHLIQTNTYLTTQPEPSMALLSLWGREHLSPFAGNRGLLSGVFLLQQMVRDVAAKNLALSIRRENERREQI